MSMNYSYSDPRIAALKKVRPSFAVEVLLTERLQGFGVSPFKTYLNTAADVIDFEVVSSKTLFDETVEWVEKEAFPNYIKNLNEVFSRQYSFASKDRVAGLEMLAFEQIVMDIVRVLTSPPSVNLSRHSVKTVSLEDVHAALKYRVPEVDVDTVYITTFAEALGGRTIVQSRRLAEDVHHYLQHNEIPYYHGEQIGVYSVVYSSQEHHLHTQLTVGDISNLVIDILPEFLI